MGEVTMIPANPSLYEKVTFPDGTVVMCLIVAWAQYGETEWLHSVFVGTDGTVGPSNQQPNMEGATFEIVEGHSS
jgi:hypothetical protein